MITVVIKHDNDNDLSLLYTHRFDSSSTISYVFACKTEKAGIFTCVHKGDKISDRTNIV